MLCRYVYLSYAPLVRVGIVSTLTKKSMECLCPLLRPVGQLNENPVHKYELVVFNIGELDLVVFIDVENEQLVFNDIEKTTSKSLI